MKLQKDLVVATSFLSSGAFSNIRHKKFSKSLIKFRAVAAMASPTLGSWVEKFYVSASDFARELEVKCSRGQVRITAQEVTGSIPGNDMLFFLFFPKIVHACASACKCSIFV